MHKRRNPGVGWWFFQLVGLASKDCDWHRQLISTVILKIKILQKYKLYIIMIIHKAKGNKALIFQNIFHTTSFIHLFLPSCKLPYF